MKSLWFLTTKTKMPLYNLKTEQELFHEQEEVTVAVYKTKEDTNKLKVYVYKLNKQKPLIEYPEMKRTTFDILFEEPIKRFKIPLKDVSQRILE